MVEHAHQAVGAVGVGCDLEYFQHELASISVRRIGTRRVGGAQTKVAVALPWQGVDRDSQPIKIAGDSLGFRRT